MTTASLLVMWLADQITQHGVGNGTSLIIMINITSRLPVAIIEAWTRYFGLGGITAARSPVELLLLLIFGFLIMMGTVMLTQGVRKVPIHSTRRPAPVGPVGQHAVLTAKSRLYGVRRVRGRPHAPKPCDALNGSYGVIPAGVPVPPASRSTICAQTCAARSALSASTPY